MWVMGGLVVCLVVVVVRWWVCVGRGGVGGWGVGVGLFGWRGGGFSGEGKSQTLDV